MIQLFIAVVIFEFINIIKAQKTFISYKRQKYSVCTEKTFKNGIIIILPCHKEYVLIESTIKYFASVANKNVRILLVTGEEQNNDIDSYQLIKNEIKKYGFINIEVIKEPNTKSVKASKLNYALGYIQKQNYLNWEKTYVAVYDFDSRPHKDTFKWVLNDLSQNPETVDIYQQTPIYLTNFSSNNLLNNYYIQHFKRSITSEGFPIFGNTKNLLYLMGSGMFISVELLKKNNGIPEYSDDIQLAIELSTSKPIIGRVVPYYSVNQIPNQWIDVFNQLLRIYFGYFGRNSRLLDMNLYSMIILLFDFFYNFYIIAFGLILYIYNLKLFWFFLTTFFCMNAFYTYLFNKVYYLTYSKYFYTNISSFLVSLATFGMNSILRLVVFIYFLFNRNRINNLFSLKSSKKGERK